MRAGSRQESPADAAVGSRDERRRIRPLTRGKLGVLPFLLASNQIKHAKKSDDGCYEPGDVICVCLAKCLEYDLY